MRITSYPTVFPKDMGGSVPAIPKTGPASFAAELTSKIKEVDQLQHQSDNAMDEAAVKGAEEIHETMIKLDEAEVGLKLMVKTRNKAMEAYQEIMRMQF